MSDQSKQKPKKDAIATRGGRFLAMVEQQFSSEMSSDLAWGAHQQRLAQHMFAKVDMVLGDMEAKRVARNQKKTAFAWENVNLQKLALDTVHRVSVGLDALVKNHIHPIPYYNRSTGQYDLDLRVGYTGKDFVRRKLAVEEPLEIIYHLVHENDSFEPHFRDRGQATGDDYTFEVTDPFDRGEVIGGFGYIVYDDPRKNRLIIVTQRDFERAESSAQSGDFWGKDKSRQEMQFKTVVHRVTDKIPIDPEKAAAGSLAYVEMHEGDTAIDAEVDGEANVGGELDIPVEEPVDADVVEEPEEDGAEDEEPSPPEDAGELPLEGEGAAASPEGRFLDLVNANDLSETKARMVLALEADLESVDDLEEKHYASAVKDPKTFVSLYRGRK